MSNLRLYKFTFFSTSVYVVAPSEAVARRLAKRDVKWTGDVEIKQMELLSDKVVVAKG